MYVYSNANIYIESCIPIRSYDDDSLFIDRQSNAEICIDRYKYESLYTDRTTLPIERIILLILYKDFMTCFDSTSERCGWLRSKNIKQIYQVFAKWLMKETTTLRLEK